MSLAKLFFSLVLIFSLNVKADPVLDEMGKAFGETFVRVVAQETLKWSATKAFESQAAGTAVGGVFAAYGVYKAGEAFGKAETDSQRYYAAAQGVAAVWMAVEPTTGLIVNLIVMGQMLMGSAISSDFAKRHQKIMLEIQKIEKERVAINKELFEKELTFIKKIFVKTYMYSKVIETLDAQMQNGCRNISEKTGLEQIMNCYAWFIQRNYVLAELIQIYNSMFSARYYFVSLKDVLEANELKEEDIKSKYIELVERLNTLRMNELVITNTYKDFLIKMVKLEYELSGNYERAKTLMCTKSFAAYQLDLAAIHSEFIKAKSNQDVETVFHFPARFKYLKDQFDLNTASICEFFKVKKERLVIAIKNYEEKLESIIQGEYENFAF